MTSTHSLSSVSGLSLYYVPSSLKYVTHGYLRETYHTLIPTSVANFIVLWHAYFNAYEKIIIDIKWW